MELEYMPVKQLFYITHSSRINKSASKTITFVSEYFDLLYSAYACRYMLQSAVGPC